MNIGAFAVTIAVSRREPTLLITDFAGLARRAPLLAVGMTAFMISLAGVPPTGGFWAKILVFQAAIERGGIGPWLAVIMLANSVISVVYYFAVPKQMIFEPARDESRMRSPALVNFGGGPGARGDRGGLRVPQPASPAPPRSRRSSAADRLPERVSENLLCVRPRRTFCATRIERPVRAWLS